MMRNIVWVGLVLSLWACGGSAEPSGEPASAPAVEPAGTTAGEDTPPPAEGPAEEPAEEATGPEMTSDVPCESVDDCWVEEDGETIRIIARPASRRGRDFEPCEDGEAAPVCHEGHCGAAFYGC